MTQLQQMQRAALRRSAYWILILAAVGSMTGRIMAVRSQLGETPLLSANDRSRWSTIRALVDHGTYAIDDVIWESPGRRDREWYTIDMVKHRGDDGKQHFYSSKPPLLATLMAPVYWAIQQLTGATLAEEPFYIVRLTLVLVNVLPLLAYFVLLYRLVERYGQSDFGRLLVMGGATFGTFLTTFAVTLNNHLPAAVSVLVAIYAALPLWEGTSQSAWRYALAGLFAAFAVTNELPALSLLALLTAALLWISVLRTVVFFLPGVAVVAAAFFATNYAAHQSWRPPYMHRGLGAQRATLEMRLTDAASPLQLQELIDRLRAAGVHLSDQLKLTPLEQQGWLVWDPAQEQRFVLARDGQVLRLYEWDNWYLYEGSYWTAERRSGVDRGEPSRLVYAFHVLLGHHGLLSLTPLWLISLAGLLLALAGRGGKGLGASAAGLASRPDPQATINRAATMRALAATVLLLTLVCLGFYLSRPLVDRNYGGVTNGFRWLFWFTPLWLLVMIPAADFVAQRPWLRRVALGCLLISVFSASYTPLNPWSHPWLFDYWEYVGWLDS